MADRRRSCSPRGAHALSKSPRRASELQKKASACPTHSPAPSHSFAFTARSTEAVAAPPVPTEHRRCFARSPLQKHAGHLAPSFTVISSTTSTFQSVHLSLGKGEIAISSTAAMAGPHRSWRSMRPTFTMTFPSLLSLALATVCDAEARRVDH